MGKEMRTTTDEKIANWLIEPTESFCAKKNNLFISYTTYNKDIEIVISEQ